MKQIAIYGKGGIGKSTISANLSAAISIYNKKVLQIGCDPKHDSTRLLMQGKNITTVLDYIRSTNPLDYKVEDILFHGYKEIGCVEAGGPTPGVGCAGRGIITTFELLDSFNIKGNYDYIIYDVLGDVVCGGFAVPIREEYADTIFIVTSGEYMSLYAANNILRGIQNYENSGRRIGGIIYNRRNVHDEDNRVRRFAEAVKLPIFMDIPRSDEFSISEKGNMTLIEKFEQSKIKDIFKDFAKEIIKGIELHKSNPIPEEDIEDIILLNKRLISIKNNPLSKEEKEIFKDETRHMDEIDATSPNRYLSKSMITEEPLHGCAFNGAVSMSIHIKDAVVLAHAPKSCTYISYQSITSPGRRGLFERGALLPVSVSPNFECTYMKEVDMVFGGMEVLTDKIKEIKADSPKAIIVISACPSGIIGDDIHMVKSLGDDDMPIITIKADGNMAGDYLQGMLMSYMTIAKNAIKPDVKKIPDTVNIVFEKVIAKNNNSNFETVEEYLNQMGITVNCRFICETTYEKIENFLTAPINILGYDDYTGRVLKDFFQREYDCEFLEKPFPIGFEETKTWLRIAGRVFHKERQALDIIESNEKRYNQYIQELKPILKGKKLLIITYNHSLDWILKTVSDIGVEIVKIGILNFSQDIGFRTNLNLNLNVEENYNKENIERDIKTYNPDILLANYASSLYHGDYISDTIPMCPDTGFYSGVKIAQRWAKLIKLNVKGEWANDERLFKKYYTR